MLRARGVEEETGCGRLPLIGAAEARLGRAAVQGDPGVAARAAGPVQVMLRGPPEWRHEDASPSLAQRTRRPGFSVNVAVRGRPGRGVAHAEIRHLPYQF